MSDWRQTLDVLMRERGSALFGYAYVLTGSAPHAEDLLQDALVRTFRTGKSSRGLDSAHMYVKRAITTAFIDGGRRSAVRPKAADVDPTDDAVATKSAIGDHASAVAATLDLHAAILELPPRERACVVLHYLEDMPLASVAAELGLAVGTVKRYLADAVSRLRVTYTDIDFTPSHDATVRVTAPEGQHR